VQLSLIVAFTVILLNVSVDVLLSQWFHYDFRRHFGWRVVQHVLWCWFPDRYGTSSVLFLCVDCFL